MKLLSVECSECGWSDSIAEFDDLWDEYLALEDDCPNCARLTLEAI